MHRDPDELQRDLERQRRRVQEDGARVAADKHKASKALLRANSGEPPPQPPATPGATQQPNG